MIIQRIAGGNGKQHIGLWQIKYAWGQRSIPQSVIELNSPQMRGGGAGMGSHREAPHIRTSQNFHTERPPKQSLHRLWLLADRCHKYPT